MDLFWGDRCVTLVDPDGYTKMVGTHKAEPSAKEMKKAGDDEAAADGCGGGRLTGFTPRTGYDSVSCSSRKLLNPLAHRKRNEPETIWHGGSVL
jgi:hypothetical protein